MDSLRDIKDIVRIDYNIEFYIIIALVIFVFLILFLFLFFKQRKKKKKKVSKKEIAYKNLKNINFSNTKNAVYNFSEHFIYFLNEENEQKFYELEKKLLVYKYKKDIEELSKILENEIKNLIKDIKC